MSETLFDKFEQELSEPRDNLYPNLTERDMQDLTEAEVRVFRLMRDNGWYSATEIIEVSQQREGLRRMRALRSCSLVSGIEKRRVNSDSREFEYRLVLK